MDYMEVIGFWFSENSKKKWFVKDQGFDKTIQEKFEYLIDAIGDGKCTDWLDKPEGYLALIIVLDQFTRNIYRNTKKAFSYDKKALDYAKTAISKKLDQELNKDMRAFIYMPFMHSEDLVDQEISVKLFSKLNPQGSDYAKQHYDIIKEFNRFPHRNKILNRESTPLERQFLQDNHGF